ncbi:glyoxalase-like protein [Rhexocercosporidium sp. MPI-PUGE-AT-0058]|nr:glyoxalase-like protein [Rhexocercosporidium sp. MPI-PUGE-AT-0058]
MNVVSGASMGRSCLRQTQNNTHKPQSKWHPPRKSTTSSSCHPLLRKPPSWLTDHFTITPGGYHNGQASRNKVIIFADGTYLELFNWYDTPPPLTDENLPMRFWGPKKHGLIDFALTTSSSITAEECIGDVNTRLSSPPDKDGDLGVTFQDPIAGSRKRADGVEVKWKVTRPIFSEGAKTPSQEMFPDGRIDVPFFCHDVTKRTFRVASDDEAKTTHPCGATGIAGCEILVPSDLLSEYVTVYSKILGAKPVVNAEDASGGKSFSFVLGVPQGEGSSKVVVREAKTEGDLARMKERGIGFSDLVIDLPEEVEGGKKMCGTEGIGATIWMGKLDGNPSLKYMM